MVRIVGAPEQVTEALAAVWDTIPTVLRQHCSFDTYFHRCNIVATYYWAVGDLERPGHDATPLVDVQACQVQVPTPGKPETAYEQWVLQALAQQEMAGIVHDRDDAYALCTWLEGKPENDERLDAMPPAVITAIFALHAPLVQAMLTQALCTHLPRRLVARVGVALLDQTPAPALYQDLRQGFTMPALLETLYQAYASQHFCAPRWAERQSLGTLLRHMEHQPLRLLHACWSGQRTRLREELQRLRVEAYQDFVRVALRACLIKPSALLIPGRGEAFLEAALDGDVLPHASLPAVARALLAAGEAHSLARLAPHVPQWPSPYVHALAQLSTTHPDIPERLREALHNALRTLPPRHGVQRWLDALWSMR